ncbi:MAG: TonB-dependent receptor [Bryobacteraceae bacterium]|nr:TonB-dependent receptor [Bryobacteraceae bacterium]
MQLRHLGLCPILIAAVCFGQTPTAQITGRVTDATEAVIAGAEILVTGADTGLQRRSQSNDTGYFAITLLPPGSYRISVRKDGFRTLTRTGLTLVVDQTARLDFALEVGTLAETVEVTAAAPAVESGTSAIGTVVSSKQILDMPLNSRNPLRLAYLVPGFSPSPSFGDQFNRASSFRINGGRANMNDLFLDGVSNSPPASNGFLSYAAFPSPDALQEFKVQTNSYSAEYGRTNGGVLNMVLRSGTNQFHGVFYEFLRNSKMDANNFFANRAGAALPSFKRNQFGAAGGGPIVRDKAFFFINYEGLRQRQGSSFTGTFPTALEKQGDFSASSKRVGAQCQPTQVYDPLTTRANPAGGFIRDQFPGNRIPTSRFDPVGTRVAGFYPQPNQPGDACTGINNYFSQGSARFDVNQLDTKIDWNPSEKNRLFGGVSWRRSVQTPPNQYGNIAFTDFQVNGFEIPSWNARADYTRVHSPSMILNVRAGFSTVTQDSPPPVPQDFSYTALGLPAALEAQTLRPIGFPVFNAAGYNILGQVFSSPLETFQTYSLAASATWVRGKHTFKFGLDERLNQVGSNLKQNTNGSYVFNRAMTQGPNPNVAQANLGDGLASLLLGTGASGFVQILPSVFTSNLYTAFYAQDDFKVTSKLTLNLGLRYDVENGKRDRFNQLTWFDYDVQSPIAQRAGMPDLRGGIRFQGLDAPSHYPTDWNNFGPRAGLAYSLNAKTVIRAGYGMFYPPYVGMAGNARASEGFSTQTPWVASIDGLRPENFLRNPFPNGLSLPTGNRNGLATNIGQNHPDSIDRVSIRSSYAQQWNLNVQRELPGRVALEAAYIGNKGTKLTDGGWEMNQLRPELLAQGTALQQRVANPFAGLIPSGPLAAAQVTRGQLLRPFPQYLNVTNFRPTSASSSYHALQIRVQKDFSSGSSFLLSYTNGKLIDDSVGVGVGGLESVHQDAYNRRAERAISPQDVSQRMVFSYVYEMPFGRKRKWGGNWPAWMDHVFGQWQINGIATLATGVPLPITAQNNSGGFTGVQRPNVTGSAKADSGRPTAARLAEWFNTRVFLQPAPFTLGNGPRTLSDMRAPGERSTDFSFFKSVRFSEVRRLEFRAEFFNLTNTPNFANPGLAFGTGNFGVIGAQANTPRQVQFGLKLYL